MLRILILCALLCTLSCAWCAPAAPARAAPRVVPLIVGDKLDDQGRAKPMAPSQRRLFDAIERELGIVFEIRMYPWPRAERNALAGDALIFGLPPTPERLRRLHYSDAAYSNKLWLVTRSDATFPFNGLADLRGKTLGAVRGYHYGAPFEQARGALFRVDDDIASRETRLARLMLRRVDAVLLVQSDTLDAAAVEAGVNAAMRDRLKAIGAPPGVHYSVLPKPLSAENRVCFAILDRRDDGIIARLNGALARLHAAKPN